MRPLLLCALIAATALVAAPSLAVAKGVSDAQVCGAAGCQDANSASLYALLPEGDPTDPPASAVPFLTVRLTMGGPEAQEERLAYDYLPSLGITRPHDARNVGAWVELLPRSRAALDDAVRGIALRPATELTGLPQPPRSGSGAATGANVPDPAAAKPAGATQSSPTDGDGGPAWWALTGAGLAGLGLLALLARYATSALRARPRASKSAN